jgi:hypothetical protein
MKLGHWRAGHWLGKSRADDFAVDGDDHEGSVAKSGRWFSEAWWDGHHLTHDDSGEWSAGGAGGGGRRVCRKCQARTEYRAYLEAEHDRADTATKGQAPRRFFEGRRPSLRNAPEELRDHFEAHGRPLTWSQFYAQHTEREPVYEGLY